MVVLDPAASAMEAARAMQSNCIGTVVVQDKGRLVGLVTDRDLAVRVVGAGRDANATSLADVMSSGVAALPAEASRMEAIRAMKARNVRRIPLLDGERVAGMVTLDDLLLDEAAPLEEVAGIVRAQLGEGGPVNQRRRRASEARAEGTYWRLMSDLRAEAKLETGEQAEVALDAALPLLVRRLIPGEAEDLAAQLPSLLRERLPLPDGPDKRVTRESIEAELVRRLDVAPERASQILRAIGATLARSVSPGQIEEVRAQLPEDLRAVFPG
jgi:uncharacterized protein (DUF2267 family)/CBS-domain-containing membrane protein